MAYGIPPQMPISGSLQGMWVQTSQRGQSKGQITKARAYIPVQRLHWWSIGLHLTSMYQQTRRRSTHKCSAHCVIRQWWEHRWQTSARINTSAKCSHLTLLILVRYTITCMHMTCTCMMLCCGHVNHFASMDCRLPTAAKYTHLKAWLLW